MIELLSPLKTIEESSKLTGVVDLRFLEGGDRIPPRLLVEMITVGLVLDVTIGKVFMPTMEEVTSSGS